MRKLTKAELTNLTVVKENKLVIDLSYHKVVLPLDIGLKLIECLKEAEKYEYNYSDTDRISPLPSIEIKTLNHQEYIDIKTCELLGVTMDELKGKE